MPEHRLQKTRLFGGRWRSTLLKWRKRSQDAGEVELILQVFVHAQHKRLDLQSDRNPVLGITMRIPLDVVLRSAYTHGVMNLGVFTHISPHFRLFFNQKNST